jgi:hypothetical protein
MEVRDFRNDSGLEPEDLGILEYSLRLDLMCTFLCRVLFPESVSHRALFTLWWTKLQQLNV